MSHNNHSTIAAAPVEVRLGGRTLKASPLRLRQVGELEQWARGRVVEAAKDAIRDGSLAKSERELIMAEAYKAASSMSITAIEEGSPLGSLLNSGGGMLQVIYLSLRRHHPELTLDDVSDLIGDLRQMDEAAADVMRASGLLPDRAEDNPQPEGSPDGATKSGADESRAGV